MVEHKAALSPLLTVVYWATDILLMVLRAKISDAIIDYCQTSNVRCTFEGNKFADHSDVVGADVVGTSPVVTTGDAPTTSAPTTSSFSI